MQGYARVMNGQEVRKNLKKHGSPSVSEDLRQFALHQADFTNIPEIVSSGSYRLIGELRSRKPQRVEYKAKIRKFEYTYTETVGHARKRIALISLYKK